MLKLIGSVKIKAQLTLLFTKVAEMDNQEVSDLYKAKLKTFK
jgi:hypothetical protein